MSDRANTPELFTTERGNGGHPLLLLHGFGASGFSWRYWVPELARDHRVLSVDLKGHGRSPKPRDGRYSPHDHADAVCRLIEERDLSGVTLVGHSLGGGVSILTALRLLAAGRLDRLRAMVLVASAAFPQTLPRFVGLARVPGLASVALSALAADAVVRRIIREIVYDPGVITEEMVSGYADPLKDRGARYGILSTARQIVPPDVLDVVARLSRIDVPVQLLWGDSDRVVPLWVGERLSRALPRARLEVLPRCGHLPAEEFPEESLQRVRAFLTAL